MDPKSFHYCRALAAIQERKDAEITYQVIVHRKEEAKHAHFIPFTLGKDLRVGYVISDQMAVK